MNFFFLAREVSPKYVFGKKKYGRRSRPEYNENESQFNDEGDDITETPRSEGSGDENEIEESVPKKRRAKDSKENDYSTESDYLGIAIILLFYFIYFFYVKKCHYRWW